jgi:glycine cleavage system H protein
MFNCPEELRYARTHEWVREEDGLCVIGLTDFAQDALGDIVFVNLPEVGDELKAEQTFADVESVKAVSDVYAPVSGTVTEVNEEVVDNPALINEDPYGAWLVKVENVSGGEDLLDAAGYQEVCKEEA